MKSYKFLNNIRAVVLSAVAAATMLVACTEDIDMSNRYTMTEETILSYLEKNDSLYSEYTALLYLVPISQISESTVAQLLSARGHFTCFAPTNEAIHLYLDSLQRKGIISSASWDGFPKDDNDKTLDSIRKVIVYNSIIDGGDVMSFPTSSFNGTSDKAEDIEYSNMNDRRLSVLRGKVNPDSIYINGEFPISMKHRDIEAINGYIHAMTQVIAPSNQTLADFFYTWANEGGSNFTVMSKLILACGLTDTLSAIRDDVYETKYLRGEIENIGDFKTNTQSGFPGSTRKYGFTLFAEKDEVWARVLNKPEVSEITVEDVKYVLSSHFQGTPYDPYSSVGDVSMRGAYRCIGVNRTDFLALLQLRPYAPQSVQAVEWLTFGSNVFNTFVPFYTNTEVVPAYLSTTEKEVDTNSFYWNCRLVAALADAQFKTSKIHIERYQLKVMSEAHRILNEADRLVAELASVNADPQAVIDSSNEALADMVREQTSDVLGKVLNEASNKMKNAYARSDA